MRIVPVYMKRCVVKLDAKKGGEESRSVGNTIASQRSQSSPGGVIVPEVMSVKYIIRKPLRQAKAFGCCIWCLMSVQKVWTTQRALIQSIKPGQSLLEYLSDRKVDLIRMRLRLHCETGGTGTITLGKRILRTETAGLALLSVLMFQLEQVTY